MSKTKKNDVVEEWVMVIRVAIDDQSPFQGLVDLTEIFDLPLDTQQAIFDALTVEQRAQLKAIYG